LIENVPLRLAGEFVQQDRDPVDGTAALEVCLDLLRRGTVVHIANKYTPCIDVFFVLLEALGLLIEGGLHLAQFGGFRLHLCNSSLHGGNFLLKGINGSAFVFRGSKQVRGFVAMGSARIAASTYIVFATLLLGRELLILQLGTFGRHGDRKGKLEERGVCEVGAAAMKTDARSS
jgi:hypothetical protein